MKYFIGLAALLVIVGSGYMLINSTKSADSSAGPYKIGVIVPVTGDAAVYGEAAQKVVDLAVAKINAAGGIDGNQIEVLVEDGKCAGPNAVSAAQKLISVDKVQVIIGGFCSGETIPAVPIAEAGKVIMVSPSASSPELTGSSKYFFRVYPSDVTQGRVLAEYAAQKGWKNVAFMQEQTDYAAGLYKSFSESFTKLSGITVNEQFETKSTDFRTLISKFRNQKPDALFLGAQTAASADRILKQLEESGWHPNLILSDVPVGDPKTITKHAKYLEGAVGALFSMNESNAKYQELKTDYRARYNEDLPFAEYMSPLYDAVNILAEGIKTAGYSGEKIATWSRTIASWEGSSGSITIDANGDRASGHQPKIIKDGEVVPLR